MTESTDRRAELIAASLFGDLDATETEEFDRMRRADPTIDAELRGLGLMLGAMPRDPSSSYWDDSAPSPALRDRIAAVARGHGTPTMSADSTTTHPRLPDSGSTVPSETAAVPPVPEPVALSSRRRRWVAPLAAAACLTVGLGIGVVAMNGIASIDPDTPTGPPGTLGAVEQVDFTGEPAGVQVDGSLIAHTWGTEALLEIDGLTTGDSYSVVVVTRDGTRLEAGSFLGSDVPIDCQMNAAVYRDEAASVEITDAGGAVVAAAALPDAVS